MNKIIKNKIDNILTEKYLSYAISTIISRSLPDVRDGLKPVHRRIIYSMYQLKLFNDTPYKKSARIVGDVMGKFHPHGDQAIYDSLVRLAQNFSSRLPLIEGQGNFGNIDGDNPAAMRYTEARLEKITNYFFDGLEENAVNFKENYDGQNIEPEVLPAKLPNILLNGSSGIAVGMATNIPPHNFYELNDALIQLINKPNITISQLLKFINGPDLPTGGIINITNQEKKEIYSNGKGSFIIKSKWEIENLNNGLYQIIITEIPYQINKTRIIEQIANLINLKKIPLDDIADDSDEQIRIILKPKNRNIDPNKLMELCFKLTDLSTRFSCNFNVLVDGIIPKQLGLKDILINFIKHRKITIKRKSEFNIKKIKLRLEILTGYLTAYKYINNIIKIIRTSSDPKKLIIKKYKLSNNQVDAILGMRLGSLKRIDEISTKKEMNELNKEKNFLNKLVKNPKTLNKYMVDDILTINQNVNKNIATRKSTIDSELYNDENLNFEEFQDIEKITLLITKDNMLKKIKDHIDIKKIKHNDKTIKHAIHLVSNQKLLLFVSSGRVFTLDPNILPSGKSNPKSFIYFIDSGTNEKMVNVLIAEKEKKCILASHKGKGFIADIFSLISNQKKGKKVFNLKKDDTLLKVILCNYSHIVCVSNSKKMLIFESNSIPQLNKGGGVQLMKIKDNHSLSDIKSIDLKFGLKWSSSSKNKTLEDVDHWLGKRAQVGKKIPKYFNKNLKFDS